MTDLYIAIIVLIVESLFLLIKLLKNLDLITSAHAESEWHTVLIEVCYTRTICVYQEQECVLLIISYNALNETFLCKNIMT